MRVGGSPASGGACSPAADANNPNCGVVSAIGSLGLTGDVSGLNGFDIDPKAGTALVALSLDAATSSTLYSIDLTTGAATLPTGTANGTIGGGKRLTGLTLAANPALTVFALTSDGSLLVFAPSTPGTPSATVDVTGLQTSEKLVGIDVRPADGKLYGIGSTGRLYSVNASTGAASEVAVLSDVSTDDAPYTMLVASDFGVDFNPVADLLRVVNAAADNLRVVPSARTDLAVGDTFTDTALNPGSPGVTAAAYTNSFAGTTSTSLYVIDPSDDMLYVQGGLGGTPSPNTGALSAVGGLGIDACCDLGFDIVGGHNGLALAAIQTSGAQSEVYVIQLGTGLATPFNLAGNAVGESGTEPVIGLALELK